MVVEFVAGFLTNSIALISDAGHMFTHSFAIAIALIAILIAQKPPCHHRTFGYYRAEVLAAFINGLFLILVAIVIVHESIERIRNPVDVLGLEMLMVAFIGLATNVASIFILKGFKKSDINVKSVFLHLIFDAVSSVGVVIAGVLIYFYNWTILDPIMSIVISLLILYWAYGIIRQSIRILLESAPEGMDIDQIARELKEKFPHIVDIYNIHVWTITSDIVIFSAHLKMDITCERYQEREKVISDINDYLHTKYGILESTIQIDTEGMEKTCRL